MAATRCPIREAFESAARRVGIGAGSRVVAYDEAGEGGAVRLWWLLRHLGHEERGGAGRRLPAWRDGGGPLRAGEESVEPGDFMAQHAEGHTVDADEAGAAPVLLDARAPVRYRGESEPIDPVAGHIPGAVNVPSGARARWTLPRPGGAARPTRARAAPRGAARWSRTAGRA